MCTYQLNSYFEQLVRLIASQGGDVFKFAGDALIVLWPESKEDLATRTRRAAQCALDIQKNLNAAELSKDPPVSLSIKLGVGVGPINIVHIGGVLNRVEYLAVGNPLVQVCRIHITLIFDFCILSFFLSFFLSFSLSHMHTASGRLFH
jgi:class 3 adenylate cyclase